MLLAALCALGGCGRRAATQIVIRIDADGQVRAVLRAVRVNVTRQSGGDVVLSDAGFVLARADGGADAGAPPAGQRVYNLPGEVGLVARDPNDHRPMTVTVTAVLDDMSTFDQTATVAFETGRTVVLDMFLQNLCRPSVPGAYACTSMASCGRCGCLPNERGRLPDFVPGDAGGAVDAAPPPPEDDAGDSGTNTSWCQPVAPPERPRGLFDLDLPDAAAANGTAGMYGSQRGCAQSSGGTQLDGGTTEPDRARYFVVRHITFGFPPLTDWQRVGFDLDGLCTGDPMHPGDPAAAPSCMTPSVPGGAVPDGERGRDNGFAAVLGGPIQSSMVLTEQTINRNITHGLGSIALRVTGLSGPNDGDVSVEVLPVGMAHAAGHAYVPGQGDDALRWDGTDVWHVLASIAYDRVNPVLAQAHSFTGYTASGTLVARLAPRAQILFAQQSGFTARFTVTGGLFTGPVGCDLTTLGPMEASAWIPVEDLRADLPQFGLCPGTVNYNIVSNFITQAADLYVAGDEVRQEPTLECNSISIGFRIDLFPMVRGCDETEPGSMPMSCDDAGGLPDGFSLDGLSLDGFSLDGFSFDTGRPRG